MLIHNKDDIEFVTEFPCFLGHPVYYRFTSIRHMTVKWEDDIYAIIFVYLMLFKSK